MDVSNVQIPQFLSSNLRCLRRRLNYSQEELAQRVGLNRGNIASYENGTAEPKICNLLKFSVLFGVSIVDLTQRDMAEEENYEAAVAYYQEITHQEQTLIKQFEQHTTDLGEFIESLYNCFQFKVKKVGELPQGQQFMVSSFEELFQATQQLAAQHRELIEFLRCKLIRPVRPENKATTDTVSL